MANKLTKEKLDLLIEQTLKEAEYVTGAEMPKQRGGFDFGQPWFGKVIQTTPDFQRNIQRVAEFCRGVEVKFAKNTDLGSRFKRTMATEMLHKFLNVSIPETSMMGYNPFHSGFGMETMIVNLFRGEIIDGEADDIVFKSPGRKGARYSLKFYTESSIKKYGFGQALGTIAAWLNSNQSPSSLLNYVVFVKTSEPDKVGFKVFFKKFTRKDISRAFNKKMTELRAELPTSSEEDEALGAEAGLTPEEIEKIKNTVVLYKGTLDEMKYVDEILLPRDISELMNISFRELDEDIKELYTSLSDFKEAMVEYHKGEQTPNERQNSLKTYDALKQAADKNLQISKQPEFVVEENKKIETKTKKDLDKLIERVIIYNMNK
jgi:hypothetical protein